MNTDTISFGFGISSIIIWFFVYIPQFIETYKIKTSRALNFYFLLLWLWGDVLTYIGATLGNVSILIFWSSIYHIIFNIIFIIQWAYYYCFYDYIDSQSEETTPFFSNRHIVNDSKWKILCASACILSIAIIKYFVFLQINVLVLGTVISWISNLIYILARIPQLYLNTVRKSMYGLSFSTFLLIFIANQTFLISLLVQCNINVECYIDNLPWIGGICITTILDLFIFCQFYLYRSGQENEIVTSV